MNRFPLALVVLLVLPGCSALGGGGDAGPAETVTPVPVTDAESVDRGVATETPTPTPERPERPDGGAFADLLDDHARRIANVSYAYRRTIREVDEDGDSIPDVTVEGYRGRNATVYYVNRTRGGRSDRGWSNGTVYAAAEGDGDETDYDATRASQGRSEYRDDVERLRRLFHYARPTAIDENETHYRIEAVFVRRDGESILGPDAAVENSSLSVAVTKAGLIESYRIEIHGQREDGEQIDVVERFSLNRSVDTLPRPDWVDRAIEQVRAEQFGNRLPGFGYVDEHRAALENTSYAYSVTTETDNPGVARNLHNETVRGYSGQQRGVLLFNRTVEDFDSVDGVWSNGTVTASKSVDGESTSYDVNREPAPFDGRDASRLRQRLEFAELTERRTNGTHELIEARLVERDGSSAFGPDVTVRSSSLSLVVAEDGVIEAYDLTATVVNEDGERATVTERFRLDRSVDTLPRPDWVDRAIDDETAG